MTEDLQCCPFCGDCPELVDHRTLWAVVCQCGASMLGERAEEPDGSEDEPFWNRVRQTAIDRWNTRAASAQSGWRPISEAPKDGTKLLLWATRNTMLVPTPEVVSGWYANGWWGDESTLSNATDWQPLPAAPRGSV